jgi:hypothetical protein
MAIQPKRSKCRIWNMVIVRNVIAKFHTTSISFDIETKVVWLKKVLNEWSQ